MKRSYDDSDHARMSALRQLGEVVDSIYMRAVVRLSRMSISAPGRKVLSKAQSAAYMPTAQYARRHLVPGDITGLATSLDMLEYALRARSIASPFAQTAPVLPVDLASPTPLNSPVRRVMPSAPGDARAWKTFATSLYPFARCPIGSCRGVLNMLRGRAGPMPTLRSWQRSSTRSASPTPPLRPKCISWVFPSSELLPTPDCGGNAAPLSVFGAGRRSLSTNCDPRT